MVIKFGFFVLLISFSLFLLPPVLSNTNKLGGINWWCNKTPYPKPCFHHLSQQNHNSAPIWRHQFRDLAVKIAMEEALDALNHTKWLGSKCRNDQEKAAWSDCTKLIEITILRLNQALENSGKHTIDFDIQTWLSAALTNLDTCRTGFMELGVAENILPLIFNNNLTELISNTLAVNNGSIEEQSFEKGFPTWLSTGDRRRVRLLATTKPNLVVAKDGSGNCHTIKQALDASAKRSDNGRFVIYVKKGVYNERVQITDNMKNIMMIGDGINNTIITGSRSRAYSTTFDSATFSVYGSGFIARGITFRNTAGAAKEQAVALMSLSDSSVFYQCSFEGYQDTLCVHSNRQFYKQCDIYGTVDFIFGNALVVFQNCVMYTRTPIQGQPNVVTAQGRTDPNQNTGISIHNSRVVTSSSKTKTYLGRPWKGYSRTVYLKTYLDSLVDPAGWLRWRGDFALKTLYYGEYNNNGPGSSTAGRVKWGGYRVIKGRAEAEKFTVVNFIGGQLWLPSSGVPFTPGL